MSGGGSLKLGDFDFPGVFPYEAKKVTMKKTSLIDRMYGVEYTKFEQNQINEFYKAQKSDYVEITGFVSWLSNNRFILLPPNTVACVYLICQIDEGMKLPPDNEFIFCRGVLGIDINKNSSAYKVLTVEDYHTTKPDFGAIESDVEPKDFHGYVFDHWVGIDENTERYLLLSLISSPSTATRVGGLTESLFTYPRLRILLNRLQQDLTRAISLELLGTKAPFFEIRELEQKHRLPGLSWKYFSSEFDNISDTTSARLNRIPGKNNSEYSISLLSKTKIPTNFDEEGLVKSDTPLIFQDGIERRRSPYYTDLKINKYLIAAHMNNPVIESYDYQKGLEHVQEKLRGFVDDKEYLQKTMLGYNKFLNVGPDGKPLSVINLTSSFARSIGNLQIDFENIKNSANDFFENLDNLFRIWEDEQSFGKINANATLSVEEQRTLVYILKNGAQTPADLCQQLNISVAEMARIIKSLVRKGTLYMPENEKYDTTM